MIRLHAVPGSRSFRVHWLLAEMGLEPEVENYRIGDGSLGTDDFHLVNPAGRVPALEIDGMTLIESGAIVEYLCETRSEHGLGRLPGDAERAEFLVWLHYAETVATCIQNLNLQQVFLPDPAMRSPTVIGLETRRLAKALKPVAKRVEAQDYLLASGFSAVDVMFGFGIEAAFHYVHAEKFPTLAAYQKRLAARPAYQTAFAAQGPDTIYKQDFYEVPVG
ncbi:glutathione S-transferase [Maritimibacter alkaliphilus]|uniref:Glutathione S-transferase family protein n=1 Tax=Maritimibacter alkaliphilus HTCC2654 TaxID=314271 RepID=A3VI83_9RHOB|nr:glutathione S-transferase [Maritimibacter alkaliphilus]EAQ12082.1 glutathione S-transferase family protein [Rhodobacterales bacterium HTCC2654] [Maritimibacter alkaliphilus HTCC2654]TYP83133.1 glutathione S-transferase [Maritimibacter alkaliphilus HTCC2654]